MTDHKTDTPELGRVRPHGVTRLLYRITKELQDGRDSLEEALSKTVDHMAYFGFLRTTIALQDSSTGELRLEVTQRLDCDAHSRAAVHQDQDCKTRALATLAYPSRPC